MNERSGLPPSVILFASLFAAQASLLVVSPILPQVAKEFGVSTATAAQMRSVSGITAGIVALILAARGDRYRLTRLLTAGLTLLGAGALVSAATPSFFVLMAAQFVTGLGLALVLSGGLAASEAWAAAGESTRLLSWALIGQPMAWIVGQPLVGLVAGSNWRWAWIAVPFTSSAVALGTVVARDRTIPVGGRECDPMGLWKLSGVKGWAVGELLAFAAWAGTLVYAGAFFITTYGVSVGVTGAILGLIAAAYLPGNFLGRRSLRAGPTVVLLASSTGAAVTVAVLGSIRPGLVFSTIVFSVLSFFAAGRTIAGAALGLTLGQGRRLAAMSVRTAMLQFGYLLGTLLGGAVLSQWGYAGVGCAFAVLFAAAAALRIPHLLGGGGVRDGGAIPLRRERIRG